MAKKPKNQTVTIKRSRDGSITFKSTGGYDLRKLGILPDENKPKKAGA
ncbi:hypothetical protein H4S14_000772 [Agrobacterium vitis]|nr:hypothetical protein [Agrobacterium vitis]MBE1437045.1 hypothetical protein [Agrobacterium vitis]